MVLIVYFYELVTTICSIYEKNKKRNGVRNKVERAIERAASQGRALSGEAVGR
jgi:hypothetical protein